MASFTVRTVNSKFITDTILDVDTATAAQAIGVRGAVAMVVDDISGGADSAAATVMVGDGENVLSYLSVSLAVSTLSSK